MTKETWWVRLRRDGTVAHQVADKPKGRGWHGVDRCGDLARETFKPGKGWVPREKAAHHAAIDAAHEADHGAFQIVLDRAVKEIEARILLGTLSTDGRVAREAALRGVPVEDLARHILALADLDQKDRDRIAKKLAV